MASNYPSSLPVKDAAGTNLSTNPHSALHDDMYDDIVAIATELGTTPKGTFASVKARLDDLALLGVKDYATRITSTSFSSVSGTQDIGSLSVTWTATAGRLYRLSAYVPELQQATTAIVDLIIADSSDTQFARSRLSLENSFRSPLSVSCLTTASGSVTFKTRITPSVGTTTMTLSSAQPAYMIVEDIGES